MDHSTQPALPTALPSKGIRFEFENAIDSGKHDGEYWDFVASRMDGVCWEEAIFRAIEDGRFFDDFVDYLMEKELP